MGGQIVALPMGFWYTLKGFTLRENCYFIAFLSFYGFLVLDSSWERKSLKNLKFGRVRVCIGFFNYTEKSKKTVFYGRFENECFLIS